VIEAFAEQFSGSAYTSARIHTRGRFSRLYGRFEASIKAPIGGKGVWPAFWLLGDSIGGEGWPECGEIDIMEQRGSAPLLNVGSAHGPEMFSIDAWSRTYALPSGQPYSSGFHVFAIEWEAGQVRWEVDGKIFHSMTTADLETNGKRWVFDGPMFILLNLAVGGKFDGDPNGSTPFPQKMLIDYVRVYE
jgi:beta-glucanase (GH16 family)